MTSLPIAVLISGRGSNLAALLAASAALRRGLSPWRAAVDPSAEADGGPIPRACPEVRLVVSDRAEAPGLVYARERQIPTVVLPGPERDRREAALCEALAEAAPSLVVLAGFLRVLSADCVARLPPMVNIHPSLLPAYRGLDTHARVLAAGDAWHGASVHRVTAELDGGPVLAEVRIAVHPEDDPASLAARLLPFEHQLLSASVAAIAAFPAMVQDPLPSIDGVALARPLRWNPERGLTADDPTLDAKLVAAGLAAADAGGGRTDPLRGPL